MVQATKTLMKEAAVEAHPAEYLHYRDYLREVYKRVKAELSSYSWLQFAEDLGFSRTNVIHLVIQGKRPLSAKAAEKVVEA